MARCLTLLCPLAALFVASYAVLPLVQGKVVPGEVASTGTRISAVSTAVPQNQTATLANAVEVALIALAPEDLSLVKTPFSSVEDCLLSFNKAFLAGNDIRANLALDYLQWRFTEALRSDAVLQLDALALVTLLSKPWVVEELEVFHTVRRWRQANPNEGASVVRALNNQIRFVGIYPDQLYDTVLPSKLVTVDKVLQTLVLKAKGPKTELSYLRFPNQLARENVARVAQGASVVVGSCSANPPPILERSGSDTCYGAMLVVKLGAVFNINKVTTHLYSNYCVILEHSLDREHWTRVGGPTSSASRHEFNFAATRARFIRVSKCESSNSDIRMYQLTALYEA